MRKIVSVGAIGPIALLMIVWMGHHRHGGIPTSLEEESFALEGLEMGSVKLPAPDAIIGSIVSAEREALEVDRQQGSWNGARDHLIAVVPIHLSDDGVDYLAFPDRYLPSFHGAHAIAFWIFAGQPDGTFRRVLSGRQDEVRLLRTSTNGLRDIDGIYASAVPEIAHWRDDGSRYERQESATR